MAKTRRKGSIRKRGEDSWQIRLSLGRNALGKRKFYTTTVTGKKADAQKELNKRLREQDIGIFVESSKLTLNEFFNNWLESVSKIKTSARTWYGHESIFNRYFRDTIGTKRLDRLEPLDLQNVYAGLLARGLSAQTVRHAHAVIRSALKQAMRWNLISISPAALVELPKVHRKERRVLDGGESRRFVESCKEFKHGLVFEFALLTGMRPEEYLAIKWEDLDFEKEIAKVQRALVRHKGGWSFNSPKTSRSRRTIVLPSSLVHSIVLHKQRQTFDRLRAANLWVDHDLVFCSEFGTPLSIPNLTYRYFRPILEKAKLPRIRLYDLRHTHATLLLVAEENPKVVSERLGHSTVVLTLDTYSHVLPTMQKQATDKLEKMIFG
jgi:integrase